MATNGFSNGVPHVNGDTQTDGVSAHPKSLQSDDTLQNNNLTHNLKAKGHDRKSSSYAAKHKLAPHFIGGNHLDVAAPSSVKEFVANHDGHTVITNVSNSNSELAGNILINLSSIGAYCQQWNCSCQGNPIGPEMGLRDLRG